MLQGLLKKFQQLFSGSAAPPPDSSRAKQARVQLFNEIMKATDDGVITTEEMTDIRALQVKLGMSDAELNDMKIQVLRSLIERVMEDGIVTEEEMDFIEQIEIDLQLGVSDSLKIKSDIEKVRQMYRNPPQQGVIYEDNDNFEDDFFEDTFENEYEEYDDDEYEDDDEGLSVGEAAALAGVAVGGAMLADELLNNEDTNNDEESSEEDSEDEMMSDES